MRESRVAAAGILTRGAIALRQALWRMACDGAGRGLHVVYVGPPGATITRGVDLQLVGVLPRFAARFEFGLPYILPSWHEAWSTAN